MSEENTNTPSEDTLGQQTGMRAMRFSEAPQKKGILEDIPPHPDLGDKAMNETEGLKNALGDFLTDSGKSTTSTTTVTKPQPNQSADGTTSTTTFTTPELKKDNGTTTTTTVTTPAPAPVPDPAALADEITNRVTENLKTKGGAEEKTATDDFKLPKSEQVKVSNLRKMEEMNPEKYKGYAEQYEKNVTEYLKYVEKWEKENPGQGFDPDHYQHQEFIEDHRMDDWGADDYTNAAAERASEEAVKRVKADQEREQHIKTLEPQIFSNATKEAGNVITDLLGEDGAKPFLNENGGVVFDEKGNFTESAVKSNPVAANIAKDAAHEIATYNMAMDRMFQGLDPLDADNNQVQATIFNFIHGEEQAMLTVPPEARRNQQGQYFIEGHKYWDLPEDQRANYYTFTAADLKSKMREKIAGVYRGRLSEEQKRFSNYLEAMGGKPSGYQKEPAKTGDPAPQVPSEYDKMHGNTGNSDSTPPKSPDGGLHSGRKGEKEGVESESEQRLSGWFKTF